MGAARREDLLLSTREQDANLGHLPSHPYYISALPDSFSRTAAAFSAFPKSTLSPTKTLAPASTLADPTRHRSSALTFLFVPTSSWPQWPFSGPLPLSHSTSPSLLTRTERGRERGDRCQVLKTAISKTSSTTTALSFMVGQIWLLTYCAIYNHRNRPHQ
jgi:hypothetical protein